MTTIVFTKDQVAADSQVTSGMGRSQHNSYTKIHENARYIVGGAGSAGQCNRVIDWVLGNFVDDEGNPCMPYLHEKEDPEYSVAFIDKLDGSLHTIEGLLFDVIPAEYPFAIGSGAEFALGYLYKRSLKDAALKAVKAAAHNDLFTNANVKVIDVKLVDPEDLEVPDDIGNH